jgi:hypothetical protein
MSPDLTKEAFECRGLAAEYRGKADEALPADRPIFMYFHYCFLELAEAYEQHACPFQTFTLTRVVRVEDRLRRLLKSGQAGWTIGVAVSTLSGGTEPLVEYRFARFHRRLYFHGWRSAHVARPGGQHGAGRPKL